MSDKEKKKDDDKAPLIVIKRVKKVAGGHHGGAWKIALADFMTAMFAFFLVMWLVGSVTEKQKKGIAEYFAPVIASRPYSSGSGGLLGGTFLSTDGAKTSESANSTGNDTSDTKEMKKGENEDSGADGGNSEEAKMDGEDGKSFSEATEEIRDKINKNEMAAKLGDNILIDITHEGLRIQIVDNKNQSMFEPGSAVPMPHTVELIRLVSKVIQELPNKLSIRGHTDSSPLNINNEYTNWELSSDRANTTRRIMLEAGIDEKRIENVQGKADREQLDLNEPTSPRNRRVSIVLIRQSISKTTQEKRQKVKQVPSIKKREEGVIYFP